MDPISSPLEVVDTAGVHRVATADDVVVDAWTRHHGELFAFLVRMTRSPEVAEDLLQEAFLRLTREARDGRVPDNVRAWLYRVSSNLAVSRGRRISRALRGIVRLVSSSPPDRTDETPEADYLRHERRTEVAEALADLPAPTRAAMLLAAEGFTGAEIAQAIGMSETATRTMLCRARLRVRTTLERTEGVR